MFSRFKKITSSRSSYSRFLPYALLSALVAFVGLRAGNGDGGRTLNLTDKKDSNPIIPTAFADTPHNDGGDGGDGIADCGSASGSASDASAGCGCCFPAKAQVITPSGPVAISSLKVGDEVVSYDENTSEFTTSTIVKVMVHSESSSDAHDFIKHPLLKVSYAENGQTKTVLVTSNHPVYNPETGTYQPVGEFGPGSKLLTMDREVDIEKVETVELNEHFEEREERKVFNLSVSNGPNTYIADGIVVHNKAAGDSDCY